jgi:hypothetical protein
MLLSACTGITDSGVNKSAVQEKLKTIDEYKAGITGSQVKDNDLMDGTFRSFKFGVSKEIVQSMETLPLNEEFTDALDYSGSGIYGYDMMLTYWFSGDNQLYSASYSMENSKYTDTVNGLMEALSGEYGDPAEAGSFDSAETAVTFDSDTEAMQAVDNDGAYYYAVFVDSSGIDIELYARKIGTGYDYWVYYTDYSYYVE